MSMMKSAMLELVILGMATAALSVTLTKTHITESLREWLWKQPNLKTVAKLADCPYCMSHWVALFFVGFGLEWQGFFSFLISWFAVIAFSAIVIGTVIKLFIWDQREYDKLHEQLDEAHELLKTLTP
jgi:hypothetical protein